MNALFQLFDTNHDGEINVHEFCMGVVILTVHGNTREKARLVFHALDKDDSGFLDKEELKKALRLSLVILPTVAAEKHQNHAGWAALGASAALFAQEAEFRRDQVLRLDTVGHK